MGLTRATRTRLTVLSCMMLLQVQLVHPSGVPSQLPAHWYNAPVPPAGGLSADQWRQLIEFGPNAWTWFTGALGAAGVVRPIIHAVITHNPVLSTGVGAGLGVVSSGIGCAVVQYWKDGSHATALAALKNESATRGRKLLEAESGWGVANGTLAVRDTTILEQQQTMARLRKASDELNIHWKGVAAELHGNLSAALSANAKQGVCPNEANTTTDEQFAALQQRIKDLEVELKDWKDAHRQIEKKVDEMDADKIIAETESKITTHTRDVWEAVLSNTTQELITCNHNNSGLTENVRQLNSTVQTLTFGMFSVTVCLVLVLVWLGFYWQWYQEKDASAKSHAELYLAEFEANHAIKLNSPEIQRGAAPPDCSGVTTRDSKWRNDMHKASLAGLTLSTAAVTRRAGLSCMELNAPPNATETNDTFSHRWKTRHLILFVLGVIVFVWVCGESVLNILHGFWPTVSVQDNREVDLLFTNHETCKACAARKLWDMKFCVPCINLTTSIQRRVVGAVYSP